MYFILELNVETIYIEDDDDDSAVFSSRMKRKKRTDEDSLARRLEVADGASPWSVTLSGEEAQKYKEYGKRHNKYKEKYFPHPRDYNKVNFKKSNTGHRNISMRENCTFQCALQEKGWGMSSQ